jgi:chaperone modulatory protein CbpM
MTEQDKELVNVEIVDETMEITIVELCRSCAVDAELVEAMIEEGVIEPARKRDDGWRFTLSTVKRTRVAVRLQRDLGVNLAGAALAIELLERLEQLERLQQT